MKVSNKMMASLAIDVVGNGTPAATARAELALDVLCDVLGADAEDARLRIRDWCIAHVWDDSDDSVVAEQLTLVAAREPAVV